MRDTSLLLLMIAFLTASHLQLAIADSDAEQYDYESLNSFQEIERIGRQATRRNQIQGSNGENHNHHHPKIEKLDVQCSPRGLQVTVDFDSQFDGLIYSRGHFSDPKCRYVEANSRSQTHSFLVPSNGCGTQKDDLAGTISNILIFQMDETVQEIWDTAKKVSCQTGGQQPQSNKQGKMVIFKPLTVRMLDVQHHKMSPSDALDCWMDIQKGAFPNIKPIGGLVEIGEELSVLIYIKDDEKQYDISVKDCWAYDSENFEDSKTSKVQLTGYDGCPRKTKLIGNWIKTFETGDSGATTIAFTNMTAFKFPNTDHVHLTCNIELCKDICEESCQSNPNAPVSHATERPQQYRTTPSSRTPFQTTSRPASPFPTRNQNQGYTEARPRPTPSQQTNPPFRCYDGSLDPRCITDTESDTDDNRETRPPLCFQGSTDPRCNNVQQTPPSRQTQPPRQSYNQPQIQSTAPSLTNYQPPQTSAKKCYPGETRPDCPPDCDNNPRDIRCRQPTTTQERCYPGSRDPACAPQTTARPIQTQPPRINTQPPRTPPQRAPFPTTTSRPFTQPPRQQSTAKQCYPGETRPDCPPDCDNNPRDIRCRQTTTTQERCYPGSRDPACAPQTTARPIQTQPPRINTQPPRIPSQRAPAPTTGRPFTQPPRQESTAKQCYPGETRPDCPPDCDNNPRDIRCRQSTTTQERCYPGSRDPACAPQTTTRPIQTQPPRINTQPPRAPPQRAPVQTTTSRPFTQPPRQQSTAKLCYPGETRPDCPPDCDNNPRDIRCRQPTTTPERCYPGSRDPACAPQTTTRPIQTQPPRINTQPPRSPPQRAPAPTTTIRPFTQPPRQESTAKQCYPGETRPDCPPDCDNNPRDIRCRQPTTTQERCYPGSRDPACAPQTTPRPIQTQPPRINTQPPRGPPQRTPVQTTTFRPFTQPPRQQSTAKLCYPGETRPDCPPDCDNNPRDIRCRQPTTTQERCHPGSRDPACAPQTTARPIQSQPPRINTQPPRAPPQRPPLQTTTSRSFTQPPRQESTTKQCYPGETRPDCPPDCDNNPRDIRCRQSTTTQERCHPGSRDPACAPQTTARPIQSQPPRINTQPPREPPQRAPVQTTTSRPFTQPPRQQSTAKLCYPGETRPDCPPDCDNNPRDIRCRQPTTTQERCYPGSREPACAPQTTARPIQTQPPRAPPQRAPFPTTTSRPFTQPPRQQSTAKLCYPGETRPDCPPDCDNNPRDIRCRQSTTTQERCYPGSRDPACAPQTTATPIHTQPPRINTQPPRAPFPTTTSRPFTQPPPQRTPVQTTSRPFTQPPRQQSTAKLCYPGETRPDCPPDCDNNPRDIRCRQSTTTQDRCYPRSRDPACVPQTTARPTQTQPPRINTQPPRAPPQRAPFPTTTSRPFTQPPPQRTPVQTTTSRPFTQPPRQQSTAKLCYPGETRPDCPPDCDNNPRDIRCRQPTTTQERCYPGSRDPACAPQTTARPIQTQPPRLNTQPPRVPPQRAPAPTTGRPFTQPPRQQSTAKQCYPGETRPDCPPDCDNNPRDIRCRQPTTTQERCYPGSRDPACAPQTTARPIQTQPPRINTQPPRGPPQRPPVQTTSRPFTKPPRQQSTAKQCYPGETRPDCPPDCDNNPRDIRCRQSTTTPERCYPGSRDPACAPQTTARPVQTQPPRINTQPPRTPPQRAPVQTTSSRPFSQPPRQQSTAKQCYPGETRPDCPPDCDNNPRDIRCRQSTTTPERCYPGSRDPACAPQTTARPVQTQPPRINTQPPRAPPQRDPFPTTTSRPFTQPPRQQSTAKLCYPGETRPDCPPDCDNNPRDIRCRQPTTTQERCYPGSRDLACAPQTTPRPAQTQPPRINTQAPPSGKLCYPGETRPDCPPDCFANPRDIRCQQEASPVIATPKPRCFPGSLDPRCLGDEPSPTERPDNRPPICYQGSLDPRCESSEPSLPPVRPTQRTQTTKKPLCYPGQIDPRCPPVCDVEGVHDRRCDNKK